VAHCMAVPVTGPAGNRPDPVPGTLALVGFNPGRQLGGDRRSGCPAR
jgi:hypothetical protein